MPSSTSQQQTLATDELDYDLPRELVATRPAEPRDSARLLVCRRSDPAFEHARVGDLPGYLRPGDAMVFNTTAVIPARLVGRRVPTGGRVEGLFLEEVAPGRWLAMLTGGRSGDVVEWLDAGGEPVRRARVLEPADEGWLLALEEPAPASEVLESIGRTPLPPYIRKARGDLAAGRRHPGDELVEDRIDRGWYETVYADPAQRHSVAAPTAGLHFTPRLLERLDEGGVRRLAVTLHVGPGTFRPITTPTLGGHHMHPERFSVAAETLEAIAEPKARVLAVGTTVVRALESLPEDPGAGYHGTTDLLIAPPYRFRRVDGLLTNFHLPRSTLLALVAAMVGLARLKELYAEAVRERYRFYSYGDAMLILP
jgi:S-adenosylmethionine:tRNA ribosyltransferase-isomerase